MKNVVRLGRSIKKNHRRPQLKPKTLRAVNAKEEEVIIGKVLDFKLEPTPLEAAPLKLTELPPLDEAESPELERPELANGDDEEAIAKPAPKKRRTRRSAKAKAGNTPLEE